MRDFFVLLKGKRHIIQSVIHYIYITVRINHGIRGGMSIAQTEEKNAVASGYWHLFRFNPDNDQPFTLDSKEPTQDYQDFIMNEVRYSSLKRAFPEKADNLFARAEQDAKAKYEQLKRRSKLYED